MQQPWRRTNRPLIGYGILYIDHAKDQSQIVWPTGLSGLVVLPQELQRLQYGALVKELELQGSLPGENG